ncbi:chemotaxis protein [Acetobacter orientalis]|uniref:CheR family methyltransferase n=1 Tax=Acetobacter orientalis TaxID=146474 RepID=UPI0020A56774|nr:CheR family methyltransferase [Acetobacter orientalis]MCP1222666.1 chemotaxis protein [Acetobacter orientalis]
MSATDALLEENFTTADFEVVRRIAHEKAGIYFPESRSTLVFSRLSRLVRESGLVSFSAYLDFVQSPAGLVAMDEMICALTTNVTGFFRERKHFVHLEEEVLPRLAEGVRQGRRGRIWSAACSTGQEPWSIAMSVLSVFPEAPQHDVRILATDINSQVVAQARAGVYPDEETSAISAAQKARFMCTEGAASMQFAGPITRLPVFKVLNLNAEWPMRGLFDAIFCRNVVIYFDEQTRNRLWQRLADKLEYGGFLYIGHSEKIACARQCGLEQVLPTIYEKRY